MRILGNGSSQRHDKEIEDLMKDFVNVVIDNKLKHRVIPENDK